MNINVPGLVNAAIEPTNGKRIEVLSQNGMNHNDPGFLSDKFPHAPPKLVFTAEDDLFDELTLESWKDEGFKVEYLPMGNGGKEYRQKLVELSKTGLGPCETFGIIAYGRAASFCLEHYHVLDNNPEFKLGCLIAYYPPTIPDPQSQYPSSIQVLVHLAGDEVGVVKTPQMVGIQGKRRLTRKKVDAGLGVGGKLKWTIGSSYSYDADPGFAERDLAGYDKISAELAWTRSLALARKAFSRNVDLESVVDENIHGKFFSRNLDQTMDPYTTTKTPNVTFLPTLTGGIGADELEKFYSDYFINSNPPSLELTLLSRTIGADRVVDELHVKFKHTREMPWILPGIPPTKKVVEVLMVSIVTLRGGKLCHEHIYWDQASVLVQTGLLNPNQVPPKASKRGVIRLPVVGRQAAKRMLEGYNGDEDGEADNQLISDWDDDEFDDEEDGNEEAVYEGAQVDELEDDEIEENGVKEGPKQLKGKSGQLPLRNGKPKSQQTNGKPMQARVESESEHF